MAADTNPVPIDAPPVVELSQISVRIDGAPILSDVTWEVRRHERWVVLGPNGSGKTTLLAVAGLTRHPSHGRVRLFGGELGRMDVRPTRARIGIMSASLTERLRPTLTALDAVMTAKHAALEPWWDDYDAADRDQARRAMVRFGVAGLEGRRLGTLSSGERQRVLLARALFSEPELMLLDEPMAAMDLGGREQVVAAIGRLVTDPEAPPTVLVTHHVEEIPTGFNHALLLRDGRIHAAGPLLATLNDHTLSGCFGLSLRVGTDGTRWTARAR